MVPEGPWEYPCGRRCGGMTCGRSSEQGVVTEGAEKGLSEPLGPIWDPPEDDASQLAPEAGESVPSVPVRNFYSVFQSL